MIILVRAIAIMIGLLILTCLLFNYPSENTLVIIVLIGGTIAIAWAAKVVQNY